MHFDMHSYSDVEYTSDMKLNMPVEYIAVCAGTAPGSDMKLASAYSPYIAIGVTSSNLQFEKHKYDMNISEYECNIEISNMK